VQKHATVLAIAALLSATVTAAGNPLDEFNDAYGNMGCHAILKEGSGKTPALLTMTCDQGEVLEAIPVMQSAGIVNAEMSQTWARLHPFTAAFAVSNIALEALIDEAYKNSPGLNVVQVHSDIQYADDFGHDKHNTAAVFSFDRATWKKINWDKFPASNIPKVSRGYRLTPWFNATAGPETE